MRWIIIIMLLACSAGGARAQTHTTSPAEGLGIQENIMRRDPSDIIKEKDQYYVWYTRHTHPEDPSGYNATIWYATSTDGHAWTEQGESLPRGPQGSFDEHSVFTPNIMVAEGKYWLFYTAVPEPFINQGEMSSKTAIGLAVSDSPDGPWKKLDNNPVLKPSDDREAFDSLRVDDTCLIVRDGKYWMYYKGRQWNNSPGKTKMGVAISDKPEGPYIKHKANPIIQGGHAVVVWPYGEGVVALIGKAGPPGIQNTLQYAQDGISFEKTEDVTNGPRAGGTYRPEAFTDSGEGKMVEWGLHIGPKETRRLPFLERVNFLWKDDAPAETKKTTLSSSFGEATPKPNVVFIFVDDLGYGDLGCYGATKVQTPNIDRLAAEGRRFTDAHSASAVCTPSRYALLTGDYPLRHGDHGIWGPLSYKTGLLIGTDRQTLGKVFQESGYSTACVGKWHLGFGEGENGWVPPLKPGPLEVGFDYYFGVPQVNSGVPFVYVENHQIVGWDPNDPLRVDKKNAAPTPTFPPEAGRKSANIFAGARKAHEIYHDERTASLLVEKATDWIGKNKAKPFFLYLPTTNIHHPFTPAPRFKGTSQCGLYGDFIHELDWMVGEVVKCLEENGVADNTLIIFTSDNGGMFNIPGQDAWDAGHRQNGELLGFKFGVWEGGHRIPFIARWPGKVEAGSVSKQLLCNVDMVSTMAALVGVEVKDGHARDSVNLLPAFTGNSEETIREHLILAPNQPQSLAVRKGKWMYISGQGSGGFTGKERGDHNFGGPPAITYAGYENSDIKNGKIKKDAPPAQLYNLDADHSQTVNLYRDYPKVVHELDALVKSYAPPPAPPKQKKQRKKGKKQ